MIFPYFFQIEHEGNDITGFVDVEADPYGYSLGDMSGLTGGDELSTDELRRLIREQEHDLIRDAIAEETVARYRSRYAS